MTQRLLALTSLSRLRITALTEITGHILVAQIPPSFHGSRVSPTFAAESCSIVQLQRAMRMVPNGG
jgi:hypothetical protein